MPFLSEEHRQRENIQYFVVFIHHLKQSQQMTIPDLIFCMIYSIVSTNNCATFLLVSKENALNYFVLFMQST